MEAWGIIMTAFSLFAMLILTVAHANLEPTNEQFDIQHNAPEKGHAGELKKAA